MNKSQQKAVEKLKATKVGALFMEPGSGKTRVAIELINETDSDFALFVCPFSTKDNLRAEINKWGLDIDYKIIGIETISMSDSKYLDLLDELKQKSKVFIIMDESVKIKNITSIRTNRMIRLAKLSEYRLILNGTPIPRNYLDLWSQFEFLDRRILKMNYNEYINTFCERTILNIKKEGVRIKKEWISDYVNLEYLYKKIEPFIFDSKLEIEKSKKYLKIGVILENVDEYHEIKDRLLYNFIDENSFMRITQLMRQSISLDKAKIEALNEILKKENNSIIFCAYRKTKEFLQNNYPQCKVMIYNSGSLGLNLQQYNSMIFFDKTFDYIQREQAEYRIYRIGQKQDCRYYDIDCNIGLDKLIQKNIDKKIKLNQYFKELIAKGGAISEDL